MDFNFLRLTLMTFFVVGCGGSNYEFAEKIHQFGDESAVFTQSSLRLETPEAMGQRLDVFNNDVVFTNAQGRVVNTIVRDYGVILGGMNRNIRVYRRDYTIQASTLLSISRIAWVMADASVNNDSGRPQAFRHLFRMSDPTSDRPFMDADQQLSPSAQALVRAGEARWESQMRYIYWAAFQEEMTPEMLGSMKSAFVSSYVSEQSVENAWKMILMSIFSASRFWLS